MFIKKSKTLLNVYNHDMISIVSHKQRIKINNGCCEETEEFCCKLKYFSLYLQGIQEYVEAESFHHFIRHRILISLEEINARLVFMRENKMETEVKI